MRFEDAVLTYNQGFPGLKTEPGSSAVPNAQKQELAMATALHYANLADYSDEFLRGEGYLHQVLGEIEHASPDMAELFRSEILDNPECTELVKSLEFMMAALHQRSPETWEHIKKHSSLSVRFFDHQRQMKQVNVPPEEQLQYMVGAMMHDAGKMAIHPELLHKTNRIDNIQMAYYLDRFAQCVPDYPEKEHDMYFMVLANQGKLQFPTHQEVDVEAAKHDVLDLESLACRRLDYDQPMDEQKANMQVLHRILDKANASMRGNWMSPQDVMAVFVPWRGALTQTDRDVINTHDPMSEYYLEQQNLPEFIKPVSQLVNMDPFRKGAGGHAPEMASIIHTADVFEALTAKRSYKEPLSVSDSLLTMYDMADEGLIEKPALEAFVDSQVWVDHAQCYGRELGDLIAISGKNPEPEQKSWRQSVMAKDPELDCGSHQIH